VRPPALPVKTTISPIRAIHLATSAFHETHSHPGNARARPSGQHPSIQKASAHRRRICRSRIHPTIDNIHSLSTWVAQSRGACGHGHPGNFRPCKEYPPIRWGMPDNPNNIRLGERIGRRRKHIAIQMAFRLPTKNISPCKKETATQKVPDHTFRRHSPTHSGFHGQVEWAVLCCGPWNDLTKK
jgi:hypothetical protein